MPRDVKIQSRRGTASEWISANPVLALGELGVEIDTHKIKAGDDETHWNDLPYVTGPVDGDNVSLQIKRDTDANLSALTTPFLSGQFVYEMTTGKVAIGDGVTLWPDLPKLNSDATYAVVAASNSSQKKKSQAEYFCTGANDDIQISEALDDYGVVRLLPGTFVTTGMMDVPENGILSGSGIGKTIITQSKSTELTQSDPIIALNQHATCESLSLNGNGWTDSDIDTNGVRLLDYSTLQNCEIYEPRQYAVYTSTAKSARILNNIVHDTKYPLCIRGEAADRWSNGCILSGNITYNCDFYIKIRSAKNCLVSNNICYISDYNTASGVTLVGGDFSYYYENIKITNNIIIDATNATGTATGSAGIDIQPDPNGLANNIMISDNFIDGMYYGIASTGVKNVTIENNNILNSRYYGLYVRSCDSPTIINNKLYNTNIRLFDTNYALVENNKINGNNTRTAGINLTTGYTATSNENKILHNTIYNCTQYGIYVTQKPGTGSPINTSIKYNILYNNPTPIFDSSIGPTKIYGNDGYATENAGIATITASDTSVVVDHGLVSTPTRYSVTPSANIGNCWVGTITATEMTIHCSSAPEADTAVSWSAQVV